MRIIELELSYFKGIESLLLNFDGRDAKIFGPNATGKTTVMDAFIWLLTGKDHLGRSDLNFNIKTLDENGEAIPMLDHTVRGKLEHGGTTFELVRTFKEVWQKKTGTNVQTFNGHKTDYYIDGVPKSEKEYTTFVERIAPMQFIYLLTMTGYFNEQIKAEDRRKMLLDICGDVDESSMLALPEFAYLSTYITSTVTVADLKKSKAAQKTKINEDIKSIPTAINVHTQYLKVEGLAAETEIDSIRKLTDAIESQTQKLFSIDNGENLSLLRKELSELEAEQISFNSLQDQGKDRATSGLRQTLSEAKGEAFEVSQKITKAERDLATLRDDKKSLTEKYDATGAEYDAEDAKIFTGSTICPTCNQPLPENKVSEAIGQFNENKSKRLEEIVSKGKAYGITLSKTAENIATTEQLLTDLREEQKSANAKVENIQAQITDISSAPQVPFDTSKIEAKKTEIFNLTMSADELKKGLAADIQRMKDEKSLHERNLSKVQNAENAAKEIEKLKAKEKELAAAYEECEKLISLCDDFTNAKVKMLDERISGAFRYAKFKLTETLVNGGMREICETLIDGVPYGAANNAARINIGLDIIAAFSAHYGVTLPIFVDNAESVCRLYPMDDMPIKPQVIQLIVPLVFDSLSPDIQEILIASYGSEDEARGTYEAPNRKLRLEAL